MSQKFEPVIGIEVHVQLKTNTKLFSTASNQFGDTPNTNVTTVCLGLPGALPVLNKRAVELAVQAGVALSCKVNTKSVFARKNYFYPDLPKGYQISQFEEPICEHGHLNIMVEGKQKRIGITRIHMEEDAGKLLHQGAEGIAGATYSIVDLNRAGCPLIEIVSEPDLRSAAEARAYMEALHEIMRHMGISEADLEKGHFRADANVSIRPVGQDAFGTRAEVKNINSFRSLERAINYEIKRQEEVILSGGTIIQETRNYDDATQKTTSLRSKEDAHDYRYFPEPDLPPLIIDEDWFTSIKSEMSEHPDAIKARYKDTYGMSDFEIGVVMGDLSLKAYFNAAISRDSGLAPKELVKWVIGDINAALKERGETFETIKLTPEGLIELVTMVQNGTISGKMAKDIIPQCLAGERPKALIESQGGGQISDESELMEMVMAVLSENPDVVEKIKNGKGQAAGFLVGQIMKRSKGKANPDTVNKLITKAIGI